MAELLKLIDALRERGAIKISTPELTVEFAAPLSVAAAVEPEQPFTMDKPLDAAEVERLMYVETSKM